VFCWKNTFFPLVPVRLGDWHHKVSGNGWKSPFFIDQAGSKKNCETCFSVPYVTFGCTCNLVKKLDLPWRDRLAQPDVKSFGTVLGWKSAYLTEKRVFRQSTL
jgi:hypothetical protein